MRLKLPVLILAILLAVPFIGTALASQEQEQLVHQQFSTAYWSIWKHSNGTWQNTGKPGDNKVHTNEYSLPQDKLKKYTITCIEVTTVYDFGPVAYQQAGESQELICGDFSNMVVRPPEQEFKKDFHVRRGYLTLSCDNVQVLGFKKIVHGN